MRLRISLIYLLAFIAFNGYSQHVVQDYFTKYNPENPEVAGFPSYGNVSVNHYTGQPVIDIPLGSVKSQRLSVSASLSYSAKGIIIDDFAGPAGQNWQLNVGGYVQRDLKGLPDELPTKGYLDVLDETQKFDTTYINERSWVAYHEKKDRDTEHDIFHVIISGRQPLKLVFNQNKKLITIPKTSVKVDHDIVNDKINAFEITYTDGTKYYFGTTNYFDEQQVEVVSAELEDQHYYTEDLGDGFFNNKWHLKKIEEYNGDYINFSYSEQYENKYAQKASKTEINPIKGYVDEEDHRGYSPIGALFMFDITAPGSAPSSSSNPKFNDPFGEGSASNPVVEWEDYFVDPNKFPPYSGGLYVSQSLVTNKTRFLESIVCKNGARITLEYVDDREDLANALRLDYIKFYNQNSQLINSIKFSFDKITSERLTNQTLSNPLSIYERSMLHYSSTYDYGAGANMNAAVLANLPSSDISRDSYKKYILEGLRPYNYKRLFLKSIEDEKSISNYQFDYITPNLIKRRVTPQTNTYGYDNQDAKIGNLNSITYSTGAYTELNYNLNNAHCVIGSVTNLLATGQFINKKTFDLTDYRQGNYGGNFYQNYQIPEADGWYKYHFLSNASKFSLYHGSSTSYPEVVEYILNEEGDSLGRTEYTFKNVLDHDPGIYSSPAEPISINTRGVAFPHPRRVNKDHLRGHLKSKKVYNEEGDLIQSITHDYAIDPDNYTPDHGLSFVGGRFAYTQNDESNFWDRNNWEPVYRYRWSFLEATANKLIRTQTTSTYQDDNGNIISSTVDYVMDEEYPELLREKIENFSDGSKLKTTYKYPVDFVIPINNFPSASNRLVGLNLLKIANKINVPVEQVVYHKPVGGSYQVIGASMIEFDLIGPTSSEKRALVHKVYKLNLDEPVSSINELAVSSLDLTWDSRYQSIEELYYDENSFNPITSITSDGIKTEYEWGYNNSLVTATTTNPDGIPQTTSYVHRPLVGPTETTDLNNFKTTFVYDDLNRLRLLKDNDGNIAERYTYHYENEPSETLSGTIQVSGTNVVGSEMTFRILGTSNNVGKSKYVWDFGDGNIEETFSTTIKHTYSSTSSRQVKVIIDNPEYSEVLELTHPNIIYAELAELEVCSETTSRDLCTGEESPAVCLAPSIPDARIAVLASLGNGASCGSLSYQWRWRKNGGNWNSFGSNSNSAIFNQVSEVGNFEVECSATDECGNDFSDSVTINIYKSDPYCAPIGGDIE